MDRLHTAGYLDNTGLLLEDPRQTQWREVLSTLDVAKGDSLVPDQSPVSEVSRTQSGPLEPLSPFACELETTFQ